MSTNDANECRLTVPGVGKQGWILKKSKHLKQYHKRFMQLKENRLLCYKTAKFHQTHERPTETFDLSSHKYRVDAHETVKEKFYLIDETSVQSRTFKAPTQSDRESWVFHIRNSISTGKIRHATVGIMDMDKYHVGFRLRRSHSKAPWTFDTLESVMASKNEHDLHDSDSDESYDDFDINQSIPKLNHTDSKRHLAPQRLNTRLSKRKTNYQISKHSFSNFRMVSLTVNASRQDLQLNLSDQDHESDDNDEAMFSLLSVDEEKDTDELTDNKRERLNTFVINEDAEIEHSYEASASHEVINRKRGQSVGHAQTGPMADFDVEDVESPHSPRILNRLDSSMINANRMYQNQRNLSIVSNNESTSIQPDETVQNTDADATEKDVDLMMDLLNEDSSESHTFYDPIIIEQLQAFGYDRSDVVCAMECVMDPQNINQIKDKLDEETCVDEKDKRARQRMFIEAEIVSTEERYCDGLNTLLNELIQPMFDLGYVDDKYSHQIRSSLPKMYEFHQHLLAKLQDIDGNDTVCAVLNACIKQKREHFIDIYNEFIKDYNGILDLFGITFHGSSSSELNRFLQMKRQERKPLSAFLILPVQRVPRYILLLRDLLKNTEETSDDYGLIQEAVGMIKDITLILNERKRAIENVSQCLQIQEALTGLPEPIVTDDGERMFIEQFIFIKKEIKHQRLFFVFSDILIIANEKWKVKHVLDIRTVDIRSIDQDKRQSFELVSPIITATYIASDAQTVLKLNKAIGTTRVQLMTSDLRQRNATLGSLKDELHRQTLLYHDIYD